MSKSLLYWSMCMYFKNHFHQYHHHDYYHNNHDTICIIINIISLPKLPMSVCSAHVSIDLIICTMYSSPREIENVLYLWVEYSSNTQCVVWLGCGSVKVWIGSLGDLVWIKMSVDLPTFVFGVAQYGWGLAHHGQIGVAQYECGLAHLGIRCGSIWVWIASLRDVV